MVEQPVFILFLLVCLVSMILSLSKHERTKKVFQYLPIPFWCYFIPTLLATANIIPYDSPFYARLSRFLLPIALFLLLIGTNLPALLKLSPRALGAMLLGTLGIYAGGLISFFLIRTAGILRAEVWAEELWKGWGCLSATWTGGSANMISIKEILNVSESLFSNLVVADTIVAYGWMAGLVFLSHYQNQIDSKIGIETKEESFILSHKHEKRLAIKKIPIFLMIAYAFSFLYEKAAGFLPVWGALLNQFTWIIIFATTVPLALSLTKLKNLESEGASSIGSFLLYILLASIGARASLASLTSAPIFILFGFLWVGLHGIFLILCGRLFKIPLSLLATASQANIGGPISAPIVASVYQKSLAPLGVLLGVLGNIYGTYAGLLFSGICRTLSEMIK